MKRGLHFFLAFAAVVTSTYGLIDADNDGMSDLWEKQYGFSTSGSASSEQDAGADPDLDGWTNLEESQAATDPASGNPPTGIVRPRLAHHTEFPTVFTVSWSSVLGKQYTLFASPDLSAPSWVQVGEPVKGTGEVIEYGLELLYEDGSIPNRLFWKVAVSDMDTDGDTINDWDELHFRVGNTLSPLNPNSSDSDRDGFADNVDVDPINNAAKADPDGANLQESLKNGLMGRWDFEGGGPQNVTLVSTQEPNKPNAGAIEISGTYAGWDGRDDWGKATCGIPWACLHLTNTASHARVPTTLLATPFQSWAMWTKFDRPGGAAPGGTAPGVLDLSTKRRTLFSFTRAAPSYGNTQDEPIIHCYLTGNIPDPAPTVIGVDLAAPPDHSIVIATHWPNGQNRPDEIILASWPIPAKLDDGHWHHLVIGFGDGKYRAYFDGAIISTPNNDDAFLGQQNSNQVSLANLNAAGNIPLCLLGQVHTTQPWGIYEPLGAQIDRLRVYNRFLTATGANSEALALYNQDIDRDGLFDRTEVVSRFWRDHDQDEVNEQSETTFPVSPFLNDAVGSDHDGDGLSSHEEQTRGTKLWGSDSDGDLLPDGWEVTHGANPHDGDTLSPLDEYRWGSNPNMTDTDGDGTNDSNEVAQGSHPNDPSDGGQPIPPEEKLTIHMAVGDQSGSNSEDYVVQCRRIDTDSGEEKHVYTLRSGGTGQFAEEDLSMFRKGVTYTFQLDWQGTSNGTSSSGPAEGPDYDYTFKVQPVGNHGATIIDSWDKENSTVDTAKPLLGENLNNVAPDEGAFQSRVENRRVALLAAKVEWEAIEGFDNLSDHVDPWSGDVKGMRLFPCASDPQNLRVMHKLKLIVRGGLKGVPVFVKSYDIDDGTDESFYSGAEVDANGRSGNDNLVDYLGTLGSGQFWEDNSWGDAAVDKVFDASGRAEFHFKVGMQPGNNYRAVVSLLNGGGLDQIQTANPSAAHYLGSELAENGGGTASVPLTVWRRLWVENDSMAGIPVDGFGYKRNDLFSRLPDPAINYSLLNSGGTGTVFFSVFARSFLDDTSSFKDLTDGRIVVQSLSHAVSGTELDIDRVRISVNGDFTSLPDGSEFRLYDDDDLGLEDSPLPRLNIVGNQLKSYFKEAFIEVVDAGDFNPRKLVTFVRNQDVYSSFTVVDDAWDLFDKNELWVCPITVAYQAGYDQDEDPSGIGESLRDGDTAPKPGGYDHSTIFVEANREAYHASLKRTDGTAAATARGNLAKYSIAVAAHEMGHQPGDASGDDDHNEGKLMAASMSQVDVNHPERMKFSSATLRRFRKATRWSK